MDLVLLLLLLTFCNILLSYSLVLIRTITAPGIPARRNSLIVREPGYVNYSVKIILINKYLCFLSVLVVPCRLVNLYDFLWYHVKGLDSEDLFVRYRGLGHLLIIGHGAVVLSCTGYGCLKCCGGQE